MIEALVFVIVAVNVWYAYQLISSRMRIRRMTDEIGENLAKIEHLMTEHFVPMNIEKHNGIYYCYTVADDAFVCQGKTEEEVYENFGKVYPDKFGMIFEGGDIWKELVNERRD